MSPRRKKAVKNNLRQSGRGVLRESRKTSPRDFPEAEKAADVAKHFGSGTRVCARLGRRAAEFCQPLKEGRLDAQLLGMPAAGSTRA